jgi:hypothetical protein
LALESRPEEQHVLVEYESALPQYQAYREVAYWPGPSIWSAVSENISSNGSFPGLTDAVEKRFFSSERARLIQDQAPLRNVDSKFYSARIYCCAFLFYRGFAVTFSTVSTQLGSQRHWPKAEWL